MSFPLFITRKYTLSKKDSRFINLISTIAIAGISLGVATLIIALSILNGFEKTLTTKIVDFDSHIQVLSFKTVLPGYKKNLEAMKTNLPEGTVINEYASSLAIISSRKIQEGISIKGITADNSALQLSENIIEGSAKLKQDNSETIIIGKRLANKLHVKLGDRVTVFALPGNKLDVDNFNPSVKRYTISGIFESGMAEYDDLNAYVTLESAQQLFKIGENITGFDIKVKNIAIIDSLTETLNSGLRYPYYARSIYQTHRNIFTWIELQKKPIPIILGLIIIVAVFNIIGTLLMIVLEKTGAVGILKSLGAKQRQIVSIFLLQGMFIAMLGIAIGNILAFSLSYIQMNYKIISIPSSVYFMSSVPVLMKPENFVIVSAATFLLCILASLIPSYIAARIKPVSTLRFS